jgi:hypothetical protein
MVTPPPGAGSVERGILKRQFRRLNRTARAVSEYMIERMLIAGVDKIAICCVCSTQAERSKP